MQQGLKASVAVAAVGLIGLLAGCGGGDGGSGSTTRTIAGRTITVPTVSTPTSGANGTSSTSTSRLSPTITLPNGVRIQRSALAPFRDCLTRHGVQAFPQNTELNRGRITPQQGAELRNRARAYGACASLLPPPLHQALERYIRQLRQRR
jgi:hypothetical protein